jgi:tRNA A-37 threonylcarbamoyl transferase component Bud32
VAFGAATVQLTGTGTGHPLAFDGYELLEEIARGGMGVVFKARQIHLKRIVALKTLLAGAWASEAELQRFRTEAEAAAHLQHPNIVAIHEVGEREGMPFFSMDYIQGQSLAEMSRVGLLDARKAAGYVRTVAQAIAFAHDRGILHRDLKPSNVLIDTFDEPRVTDFGVAKRLADDMDLTRTGQVIGTPNFMAPEQAAARHEAVGPSSDIYSIGAILYFLLTGRPPFEGGSVEETLARTLNAEAVAPRQANPSVPRDLETICLKCLEKSPGRRYGCASELADDLGRYLRDEPILARPVNRIQKTWRWGRRNPAVASLVVSLVLTLAALLAAMSSAAIRRDGSAHPRVFTEQPAPILVEVDGSTLSQTIIGDGADAAVDPKNNRYWTTTLEAGGVVVRDGQTDVILTNFFLGDCPGSVNLDPVHRAVWVGAQCGHENDAIWVVNADTFAVVAGPMRCGGVNGGPAAVCPGTGRFYHVVSDVPQRVDPGQFALTRTAFGPIVGVNASANLLYAGGPGGSLQIIDGAADPERILTNLALPFPIQPTLCYCGVNTARNRLYVPNAASNTIAVLDGRSGESVETLALEPKNGKIQMVRSVAIDESRNRIYSVAATGTGAYYLYVIQDGVQTAISIPGLAWGPVLNPGLNKVYLWMTPLRVAAPR